MIRFCVIFALFLLPACSCGQTYSSRVQNGVSLTPGPLDGLARQKAYKAAKYSIYGHVGGPLSAMVNGQRVSGRAEGVGFSNISAAHAEKKCCYSRSAISEKRGPYRTRLGTGTVYNSRTGFYFSCIIVDY